MKKYFILVVFILNGLFLFPQNWPIIYGDAIGVINRNLIEDYDNGFLIAGNVGDNQVQAKIAWLLKVDINGEILWDKKFGGAGYYSYFNVIRKTSDNSCLLAGSTSKDDTENYFDPLFIKINPCGETEWCTVIHDETVSCDNYGTGIIELSDGSSIGMIKYYGNPAQGYRISLIKLDADGYPVWVQHLAQKDSTVFNEEGYDLILTSDSNYLVAGHCFSPGLQPYFIKTDTNGEEIWNLKWSNANGLTASIDQVIEKDTGIFYSSGGGHTTGHPINPALFKFDNDGNKLYHKFLIGDTVKGSGAGPMEVLNDTTLVIGVQWRVDPIPTGDGFSEVFVIDTLGNVMNRRLLIEQNRPPSNIIKTFDDKIVVTGNYFLDGNWDVYLWKMNSDLEDDSIYSQPRVYDSLCPHDIVSDTIDLDCGLYVDIGEIPTREEYENPLKVFPNPAGNFVHVNTKPGQEKYIEVFDLYGRKVAGFRIPLTGEITVNVSSWPRGIYLFSLFEKGRFVKSEKVIIK